MHEAVTDQVTLVLASSSPRRQELVRSLGFPYRIEVSDADEQVEESLTPSQIVETLSLRKVNVIYDKLKLEQQMGRSILIGSDTIVVKDGVVLGKPINEQDAAHMLSMLQNATHQVYTGIACVDLETGQSIMRHRATDVHMKPLTDGQIKRYIATGEPMDKAGSYAIQGIGATFVESIEGDYFNVVGLSVSLLSDMLAELDVNIL
ncbi:Maf family protein [Paenibacillus sp. N1-5-1-14]|uniref:Maf family protein n=1 Tax=Paenibacillus radicibacter TaxID=2972488 RepID=UPI00215921F3|nr:Maf family protein [Paenibacillus radicibacter]MCR8644147.1 Maf family protein [Paenibacillus radicibacter]